MYVYLIDTFVQDKKYEHELLHVQARLQDLGITGRFEKLTILKSIKGIVEDAIRKGVKTLVAIGNDKTFNEMVAYLTKNSITLGLIPFGQDHNTIADRLHIPRGIHACGILSKRIIKKLDVGTVNGRYFFSSLSLPFTEEMIVECDRSYTLSTSPGSIVSIVNFCDAAHTGNAQDGHLETVIREEYAPSFFSFLSSKKRMADVSVVPAKYINIKSTVDHLPIYSEGSLVVKTPARVEIAPKKLRIIAGANSI